MNEATKAKIKAAHLKRAENPEVVERLRALATDPAMKAARSEKMKALWADPAWKAAQLTKMGKPEQLKDIAQAPVVEAPVEAPAPVARKKRVVTPEQKARYAKNRKAKRDAAKQAKEDRTLFGV